MSATAAPSEAMAGMALRERVAKETAVVRADRRMEARASGVPSSAWAKWA